MTQVTEADSKMVDKSGNFQIGNRSNSIAAAVVAHSMTDADASLGATTQAELEGMLDALSARINNIISVMENHGLAADN